MAGVRRRNRVDATARVKAGSRQWGPAKVKKGLLGSVSTAEWV